MCYVDSVIMNRSKSYGCVWSWVLHLREMLHISHRISIWWRSVISLYFCVSQPQQVNIHCDFNVLLQLGAKLETEFNFLSNSCSDDIAWMSCMTYRDMRYTVSYMNPMVCTFQRRSKGQGLNFCQGLKNILSFSNFE